MHKSRIGAFVIDCKDGDLEEALRFWGGALGREADPAGADSPTYRGLKMGEDEPVILIQKVGHDSRIHLDIEADDVDLEVDRLEALGARRVEKVKTWWVMEAPTGQRFCVVRLQRGPLGEKGNQWP